MRLLAGLLCFASCFTIFQKPAIAAGPSLAEASAAIAAYAPRALAEQGTPGLSVVVTDATHAVQTLALGYANVDAKTPVTPQTRFPIGSITKSMTALSLMQLYDAGALDLDAPVTRYEPDFRIDSGGKTISLRQLLSHTAGIPDDYSASYGYADAIYALRDARVLTPPGTAFSYSNDGFATAGDVLVRLDRKPWADSVQQRVFDALGMTHSSPVFTPENFQDAAVGYALRDPDRPQSNDPSLVASPPFDFVNPAGSVISTPADMAAYVRFYLNGGVDARGRRLISKASFAKMTTAADMNGKPAGAAKPILAEAPELYRKYGFGLSISDDGGDRIIAHTGGISGYTACMQANLTRGFGVVAFSNLVEAPLHPCAIVRYAMRVLRAQSLGLPLPQPPVAPSRTAVPKAAEYAGTYRAADGTQLVVSAAGPGAQLRDGSAVYALLPRADDTFWTDDPRFARFLLVFYRNRARVVTDLTAGSRQFVNSAYRGDTSFAHPAEYDMLAGRYETDFWMQQTVTRVVVVKGRLTFDGVTPLLDEGDGTFRSGSDVVRFDHTFDGRPQRMFVNDVEMNRVELP